MPTKRVPCSTCNARGTITFPDPNDWEKDRKVNCPDCGGKGWNEEEVE